MRPIVSLITAISSETVHMGHAMSERLYDFTLSGVVPCVKSGMAWLWLSGCVARAKRMAWLRAKQMRGYG